MRKQLLHSHENLVLNTPETSRRAVVPENTNPSRQENLVLVDLADPSLRRLAVSRLRADNKEEQKGKLLLGRTSLAFLRAGELVFSHNYLCISSYSVADGELSYTLNAEGIERPYHFYLDEPLTAREVDIQVAEAIAAANVRDGGRKGSGIKSRSGSVAMVGRGGVSPRRREHDEATADIAGTRYIVKLLGSDKQKFRCIAFLSPSGFVVLDVSRGMLRTFDWVSVSRPEKHKDRLGQPKGRVTFDYLRARQDASQPFDCNLFAITLFVKPPDEFFLAFEKMRLAPKPAMPPELPAYYP